MVSNPPGDPSRIAIAINAERIALAGWSRAILLQMSHPLIAAGVVDHSSFRDSPAASVRRLHSTVRAMLGLTFGTPAAHAKVIQDIRAIHRRVNGRLRTAVGPFPQGTPYSAEDPSLLRWVHLTLIESSVIVYDALVRPLTTAERDAYCRASSIVAIELGARPAEVPQDWAAVERDVADIHRSGVLAIGPDARAVAAALMDGPLSMAAGPIGWVHRLVTAGWLPPDIRAQYGFPWDDARARRFRRAVIGLKQLRRATPAPLALWPEARNVELRTQNSEL